MNAADNFHSIVFQRGKDFNGGRRVDHCKICLPCNVIHRFLSRRYVLVLLGSFDLVSDSAPPLEGASLVLEGHA
jgi:hypothetical protein